MLCFGSFSISKREIIISIVILLIMLIIGFMISDAIEDSMLLEQQKYNLALQIDNDKSMFEYCMSTDVGDAFVYGTLKCLDPVTYDEIDGEYSYVKKVKEKHTKHTRTVTKTRVVNGKSQSYTTTETYWTWDTVSQQSKHANKISFIDVEFKYGDIDFPGASHVKTIKESSNIRYVYYGSPIETTGTIYARLENNTINDVSFHNNMNIEETHKYYTSSAEPVIFWIVWTVVTVAIIFGFIYIDNRWLED